MHCVIVGFTLNSDAKESLWDYPSVKGEPVAVPVAEGINAYLVDGPKILISKRRKILAPDLVMATKGSQPTDAGNLIVEADEYAVVVADPIAAKYIRPFKGARELIHNTDRWCLWMADEDFQPTDVQKSVILKQRVEAVRDSRNQSQKAATRELATVPHLFAERRAQKVSYLCIPSHVGEGRRYFLSQRFSPSTICGNANFQTPDEDGLQFALISSSMFITWQKTIGGRLKSDLRFSNTLTWNTFPVPSLSDKQREAIIKAGQKVLDARALHPDRSLAEHYNPLAMDPALIKTHDALDREVDKAFGAPKKLTTDRQRQELLFNSYAALTEGE